MQSTAMLRTGKGHIKLTPVKNLLLPRDVVFCQNSVTTC